LILTVIFSKL